MKKEHDDRPMRDHYDLTGGVRGKYYERLAEGSNVIVLDPDVAEAFPNSKTVNEALRSLLTASEPK